MRLTLPKKPTKQSDTNPKPAPSLNLVTKKPVDSGLTTQAWLPIQSILDGVLTRPDGTLVAGLLIQPMNLSLMAAQEQHRVVTAFRAAMDQLLTPWQMVSTFRPVDLTDYRQGLAAMADRLPQGVRRQVLNEYQRWILSQAQGQATERLHALLVSHGPGKGAADELRKTVHDLKQNLGQIDGMHVSDLATPDWYRLVQLIFSGQPGFVDTSGPGRLAPIYDGDLDDMEGEENSHG